MEILNVTPHWEILDKKRIDLLNAIANNINVADCYMGGGTALSLQMGLRKSVGFVFFTPTKFDPLTLFAIIRDVFSGHNIDEINVSGGTCDVSVDGVQMSWFYHPYKTLEPQIKLDGLPTLILANPNEIAAMKVSAIGGRGAKKDFFDLYNIMLKNKVSTTDLANYVCTKFGTEHNYTHMCMGLDYFEDAESEPLNNVLVEYDWNKIKKFFIRLQPQFIKEIKNIIEHKKIEQQVFA